MTNPKERPDRQRTLDNQLDGITATGRMLRTLLPTCPICQRYTEGHSFAQVASAIVSDSRKSILTNLFRAARQHEWDRLLEFKEWDVESDNLVVYIISGDHPDGIVVVVKNVFELYAKDDIFLLEPITAADIASISDRGTLKWQRM
jgi:hypothetical protein